MTIKGKFSKLMHLSCKNDYSYDSFVKYVNHLTNDKLVKEMIFKYYDGLKDKDISLTKDSYDKLIIQNENGRIYEYEQDLVNDLFKDKEEIKLEEAFIYNCMNNLKKVKKYFFSIGNMAASYNHQNRFMSVPSKWNTRFFRKEDLPIYDENLKVFISHELGHVECKRTYCKDKYFMSGLDNMVYNSKTALGEFTHNGFFAPEQIKYTILDEYKKDGLIAFDEIVNEVYTSELTHKLMPAISDAYNTSNYYHREVVGRLYGDDQIYISKYNMNYDMLILLDYFTNSPELYRYRNNTNLMKERINKAEFNPLLVKKLTHSLKINGVCTGLEKLNNFDLIMAGIGLADSMCGEYQNDRFIDMGMDIKVQIQAMLINGIKNDFVKNIVKNKEKMKNEDFRNSFFNYLIDIDGILIRDSKGSDKYPTEVEYDKLLKQTGVYKDYFRYKFKLEQDFKKQQEQLSM